MRRIRPLIFSSRAASVVFGARTSDANQNGEHEQVPEPRGMPEQVEIWNGRLNAVNAPWSSAAGWLTRVNGKGAPERTTVKIPIRSPAHLKRATLLPLLAFVVSPKESSPLGLSQGRVAVQSQRSVNEKVPLEKSPALSGVVESQFIRPLFAGENVFPSASASQCSPWFPATTGHCSIRNRLTSIPAPAVVGAGFAGSGKKTDRTAKGYP